VSGAGNGRMRNRGTEMALALIVTKQGQNYLLSFAGQLVKCSPEQLRPATPEESLGEQVMKHAYKDIVTWLRETRGVQKGFVDLTEEDPPPAGTHMSRNPKRSQEQPPEHPVLSQT
jgi:hypothetical protein